MALGIARSYPSELLVDVLTIYLPLDVHSATARVHTGQAATSPRCRRFLVTDTAKTLSFASEREVRRTPIYIS